MVRIRVCYKALTIVTVSIGLALFFFFYQKPETLYIGVTSYSLLNYTEEMRQTHSQRPPPLVCGARKPIQSADIKMSELYEKLRFDTWWLSLDVSYDMNQWKDRKLEVVILPHSHHDPGWRMTFRKYLNTRAKPCLDSTLNFLDKNKEARFIYAEVSFLERWWAEMTSWQKTTFKRLVRDGQWEIATGGWVINDEASTHYAATVTQLAEGHHWLMENLGYVPNVSWAIDPFGHSTTEAYLLRKAGLEHILIHRTHYEIKQHFAKQRTLEFRWRQPWDSSGSTDVFCHMLPFGGYGVSETCGPNRGICWQYDFSGQKRFPFPWSPLPIVITSDNIAQRAEKLADQYRKKATFYNNGDVVFVPLGDDFRYLSETAWEAQFTNYKKLMDYINSKPEMRMHVQFGTLSTYFNLVKQRKPVASFPSLMGDFFTYADRNQDYWSGYFTSRPTHKALSRVVEAELRSAEILFSLARHWIPNLASKLNSETCLSLYDRISSARRSLALFQHHDAITGTARRHVMTDYRRGLSLALDNSRTVAGASLALLLGSGQQDVENAVHAQILHWGSVLLHSAGWDWPVAGAPTPPTITFTSLDQVRYLILFNNHAHERDHIVRVDLDLRKVLRTGVTQRRLISVKVSYAGGVDSHTKEAVHELQPSSEQISSGGGWSRAKSAYLFSLRAGPFTLRPLQILQLSLRLEISDFAQPSIDLFKPTLYNIVPRSISAPWLHSQVRKNPLYDSIKNKQMDLVFNPITGFLHSMTNMATGVVHPLSISFSVYKSKQAKDTSGAYLFVPELPSVPLPLNLQPKVRVARSNIVDEVTTYHPNLVHTVRSYKTGEPGRLAIEVENILDLTYPYDNHEVVMKLTTGIKNTNRTFFTDSNCLQFIRRVFYDKIPLQGNVYPMSCAAYLEDADYRITLLSAQPLGFMAGERPGEMSIWLDRRVAQGDGRGLGEGVVDNVPARSVFRILVETVSSSSSPRDNASGANVSSEIPLPGLTQEAHWALTDLIYPTSQFVFSPDISSNLMEKMRTNLLLMRPNGLPPDYELVALKTFYSTSERFTPDLHSIPGSQLGILLHRTLPYCGKTYLCARCSASTFTSSSSDQVQVSGLFRNLLIQKALRTSLTFIPRRAQENKDELPTTSLSVQPMELEAFLLLPEEPKFP